MLNMYTPKKCFPTSTFGSPKSVGRSSRKRFTTSETRLVNLDCAMTMIYKVIELEGVIERKDVVLPYKLNAIVGANFLRNDA